MQNTLESIYRSFNCLNSLKTGINKLKAIYFICQFLLSTSLIYFIMLIHTETFSKINLTENIQTIIQTGLQNRKSIIQNTLFGIITITGVLVVIFYKVKSQSFLIFKFTVFLLYNLISKFVIVILLFLLKNQISKSFDLLMLLFLILNIGIFFIVLVLFHFFLVSNQFFTVNQFSKRKNTIMASLEMIECFTIFVIIFGKQRLLTVQPIMIQITTFWILLISLVKSTTILNKNYYINEQTNLMNTTTIGLEALTSFVGFSAIIFNAKILDDNVYYLLAVIYIFGCVSLNNYIFFRKDKFQIIDPQSLESPSDAQFYLQTMFKLINSKQQINENQMLLVALKKHHQLLCVASNCYCENQALINQAGFQKSYFTQILDKIHKKFSQNAQICLKLEYFRYQSFKNYYLTYKNLQIIKKTLVNDFYNKFFMTILQNMIQKDIQSQLMYASTSADTCDLSLAFQVETVNQNIFKLIKKDIQLRALKWGYISEGNCNSIDLQRYVQNLQKNLLQVKQIYQNNFKKMNFNSDFIHSLYFYFSSVVFFKKQASSLSKSILKKIKPSKQLQNTLNNQQIKNLLLTDKCSVLLINLQDQSNIILNCTSNLEKTLYYKKLQLLNKSLQLLLPKFINKAHNEQIQKWKNSCNLQILMNSKEGYVVDKKMNVKSVLIKLEILVHENKFCIITALFFKDMEKIFLINQKKQIKYFSQNLKPISYNNEGLSIPFELIFNKSQQFDRCFNVNVREEQTFEVVFINLSNYSEEIGNFMNETERLQLKRSQQKDKFRKAFIQRLKKKIFQSDKKRILNVQLRITKKEFGTCEYFLVKIICIEHVKQILKQKLSKQNQIKTQKKNQTPQDKQYSMLMIQKQHNQHLQQTRTQQIFSKNVISACDVQNSLQKSVASSVRTTSGVTFHVMMLNLASKWENPKQIVDKRALIYSLKVIALSVFGITILSVFYYLNSLGFTQINGVYFAGGAVSDNMQLAQFTYNRIMNLKLNQNNIQKYTDTVTAGKIEQAYLYDLFKYDIQNLNVEQTPMQKLQYFEYLNHQITWIDNHKNKYNLTLLQFFQNLHYISKRVYDNSQKYNITDIQIMLELFYVNFPQLKRVNHQELVFYGDLSEKTLSLLFRITLIIVIFHVLFVFLLIGIIKWNSTFRFNQKINSLNIYKQIPNQFLLLTRKYYQNLYENTNHGKSNILKQIIKKSFQKEGFISKNKAESNYFTNNQVCILNTHRSYAWILYIFIFFVVNVSYFLGTLAIFNLYQPCSVTMTSVNALMDCQNYLLEAYFDFKAEYVINNNTILSEKYIKQFLQTINKNVVTFLEITTNQMSLFDSYDPDFHKSYKSLLINDICILVQGQVTDYQLKKCKSDYQNFMINKGVSVGMVYFQRNLQTQVYNAFNKSKTYQQATDLFNGKIFHQIDQSIFYMFKMYQATQAQIYKSLGYAISQAESINLYFNILEIALLAFLIIWTFYLYHQQKYSLGALYGTFLLIPVEVAKQVKYWVKLLKQFLEYKQNS